MKSLKRIGFLSFGAWNPGGGLTHTGGHALRQTIDPAHARGRPGNEMLPAQPQSRGLPDRLWWGSGSRETAVWAGEQGLSRMSSTLLLEDTQVPFDRLQAEQIELFHDAWAKAGHTRA